MFIKFSFKEYLVIVPQVWGGLYVGLARAPAIIDTLPKQTPANTVCHLQGAEGKRTYDFYLNVSHLQPKAIDDLLHNFLQAFPKEYLAANEYKPSNNKMVDYLLACTNVSKKATLAPNTRNHFAMLFHKLAPHQRNLHINKHENDTKLRRA